MPGQPQTPLGWAANHLPWPAIVQHPKRINAALELYLPSIECAALLIQSVWRGRGEAKPLMGSAPWIQRSRCRSVLRTAARRVDIEAFFLAETATATRKLDGTNVGIAADGALLGRRFVIGEQVSSYQSTPVALLRGRGDQVTALRAALARAAACPELEGLELVLYGELVCNDLYDFRAAACHKSWRAFGVAINATTKGNAAIVEARLRAVGLPACGRPRGRLRDCRDRHERERAGSHRRHQRCGRATCARPAAVRRDGV